jgi:3-hydroxyisobutyrate dehydrogenase-like beta-hydroxyacid dehydrogenase
MSQAISLIGFGEAGWTFASAGGWAARACAYDIASERQAVIANAGVRKAESAQAALTGSSLVLSLVTADQALNVARDYARYLPTGAIWCDMNSVAPQTKRAAAEAVAAAGARYVDAAILAPVNPARLAVPLLLAGEAADAVEPQLRSAGFSNVRVVSEEVGKASSIKMIRSVMVKGLEALTAEMMLAATAADVVDDVLASLDASEKPGSWLERSDYNLERMVTHGLRRAAEMEESVKTLRSLGIEPLMTAATVDRQRAQAGKPIKG